MSKKELMREIKCLEDLGMESNIAEFIIYKKYGYDDVADSIIQNWNDDRDDLKHNTYKYLVPYETTIIKENEQDKKEDEIDKITS